MLGPEFRVARTIGTPLALYLAIFDLAFQPLPQWQSVTDTETEAIDDLPFYLVILVDYSQA